MAVKSNYEHIKERNHSAHGLKYPESFVAIALSRNAKHAAGERNRRNRLSQAIESLKSTLPSLNGSKEGDKTAAKASVIEMAIRYIISLQQELEQCRRGYPIRTQGGELFTAHPREAVTASNRPINIEDPSTVE